MKKNSLYDIEYFQKMKAAHQNKLKRIKRRRLILLIVFILIVVYIITPISKINGISISGEKIYTEQKIKDLAQVKDNQFSLLHPSFLIKNNLNKTQLFKKVDVKKSLFNHVSIVVEENNLLFYTIEDNEIVFYDEANNRLKFPKQQQIKYQSQVGELVGNVDAKVKTKIVNKLKELDSSVISLISQIKHQPKQYDDEYFRFIMNDDKKIYIDASLNDIVKVGANYHNFAANTKYKCSIIEFINTENKAIVKKC